MAYPTLTDKPGALDTAAAIRAGKLSPSEAVDAAITRIEKLDVHVNALAVADFERASDTAKTMDGQPPREDQPLFGVPMTIKESFDIAGLPTCWGHEQYAGNIAKRDAKLVTQLKDAGVIFLGKTNVPPDLADWQSVNPVYGRTNNPHNHDRVPGGSSGGSAAAVASGMVPCEFGTDIGGSVRVPAHFCGVWGHKSSWGLISKHGHDHPAMAGKDAHDGALSIAGPIARNPDDLLALLEIGATLPLRRSDKPLSKCKLLAVLDYPGGPIDDSVRNPIEAALEELTKAGVQIDRTSDLLPDLAAQQADYMRMLNVAMARGAPAENGKRASATDWFDLLDAQAANEIAWARLFESYDFVLAPPAPVLAVPHMEGSRVFDRTIHVNGEDIPGPSGLTWAGIATFPNLPATIVPIGAGVDRGATLPCGLQVIGPRWSDLDCVIAAKSIGEMLHN
ncbi:MAG: amidase family protein [Erythrobacter sp.]